MFKLSILYTLITCSCLYSNYTLIKLGRNELAKYTYPWSWRCPGEDFTIGNELTVVFAAWQKYILSWLTLKLKKLCVLCIFLFKPTKELKYYPFCLGGIIDDLFCEVGECKVKLEHIHWHLKNYSHYDFAILPWDVETTPTSKSFIYKVHLFHNAFPELISSLHYYYSMNNKNKKFKDNPKYCVLSTYLGYFFIMSGIWDGGTD
jgi:hypothetical protein